MQAATTHHINILMVGMPWHGHAIKNAYATENE
jgi:hypothetical protein